MNNPAHDYSFETLYGFSMIDEKYSRRIEDQTGADILQFPIPGYARSDKKYALWNFSVGNAPLSAVVRFQGNQWFAELDWLNLFGGGGSPSEAVDALADHIDHYIEFYSQAKSEDLTEQAAELCDRFVSINRMP